MWILAITNTIIVNKLQFKNTLRKKKANNNNNIFIITLINKISTENFVCTTLKKKDVSTYAFDVRVHYFSIGYNTIPA